MLLPLITQINLLIFDILAGVFTGILFDIYKIIRGTNYNKIINFIEDILFWMLVSIVIFIFLSYNNYAYFEFYCYIYIFLGLFVYLKIFSKYFNIIISKVIGSMYKIIRILVNMVIYSTKNFIKKFKVKKL